MDEKEYSSSSSQVRKGPWTEQEDVQLVFYVNLFGDRRWDFIAKVSGLKRTGKSCRLRWVNYLHPGLKRGKMTPHEEALVLQLHNKWGNRWSRIARKIPGRTDNEIKNYWRTHMRKKAQEKKKKNKNNKLDISPSLSSSSSSSNFSTTTVEDTKESSLFDTGAVDLVGIGEEGEDQGTRVYSMDEIWKDMELSQGTSNTMNSHIWDVNCSANDTLLWSMDEEEMMHPFSDHLHSFPFHDHII